MPSAVSAVSGGDGIWKMRAFGMRHSVTALPGNFGRTAAEPAGDQKFRVTGGPIGHCFDIVDGDTPHSTLADRKAASRRTL